MRVAIVIPTYNEAGSVEKLIEGIFKTIPQAHCIVVDDNSSDGTGNIVVGLQKKFRQIHLVRRSQKTGRGSAVLAGFAYARKKIQPLRFIEIDGDMSHNPVEIPKMLGKSGKKSVVIASRYIKGGRFVNWPLTRNIISRIANNVIRMMTHIPSTDITNGFRCYSKEGVAVLLEHQHVSSGYIALTEMAYVLHKNNFHFVEVPSVFTNRSIGYSKRFVYEYVNGILYVIRLAFQKERL